MPRDNVNWHHIWFPERDYRDPEGRKFRNWPCQLVLLDVDAHDTLHECMEPPSRPDPAYIRAVNQKHLEGACKHPLCAGRAIVPRKGLRHPISDTTGRKRHA